MLIIIEGCDCTAKTSLARSLVDKLGDSARYQHSGPPDPDVHPLDQWEGGLYDYRPGASQHVVCDRLHWGETVYGPIKRGKSRLTDEALTHANLFLRSRGAHLVLTTATAESVISRMRDRGESFINETEVPTILEAFVNVAVRSSWDFMSEITVLDTTNITDQRLDVMAWHVLAAAAVAELGASHLAEFPRYIGNPRPSLLLLGEQCNPRIATDDGTYLMRAIGSWAGHLGIANAPENDVAALWDVLGRPPTVALGDVAADAARDAGIRFREAPHPQYWRRFHHHDLDGYRRRIFQL